MSFSDFQTARRRAEAPEFLTRPSRMTIQMGRESGGYVAAVSINLLTVAAVKKCFE
jgi:hypothetical protein